MGLFSNNKILEFKLYMDYDKSKGYGNYSYEWHELNILKDIEKEYQYAFLIILLYARLINICEKQNQQNVIDIVLKSVNTVYENLNTLEFPEWRVLVLGKGHHIWPWQQVDRQKMVKPKTYRFSLQGNRINDMLLKVKLSFGNERILVPSAVLISISMITKLLGENGLSTFYKLFIAFNNLQEWDAKNFTNRAILKSFDIAVNKIITTP